jgi:hypothetical protein
MERNVSLFPKFLRGLDLLIQDLEERRKRGETNFSSELLHIHRLLNLSGRVEVDPESRLLFQRLSSLGTSTLQTRRKR